MRAWSGLDRPECIVSSRNFRSIRAQSMSVCLWHTRLASVFIIYFFIVLITTGHASRSIYTPLVFLVCLSLCTVFLRSADEPAIWYIWIDEWVAIWILWRPDAIVWLNMPWNYCNWRKKNGWILKKLTKCNLVLFYTRKRISCLSSRNL